VALLAAINTLIQRPQLPYGVQNSRDILALAENLVLVSQAQALIAQAA